MWRRPRPAHGPFPAGLAAVRATTASVISLLVDDVEPVRAAVIGMLLLGERLTPQTACGAALLLATVRPARPSREKRLLGAKVGRFSPTVTQRPPHKGRRTKAVT